ncbi:MAG: hypothetical protein A2Z71_10065 [Chloroflexi bacterium RBG_13_50_21]|nr:MAG: hypothetical protein A2Z71_10065 [Chloroflexi bacterium RBG_13_50_21]
MYPIPVLRIIGIFLGLGWFSTPGFPQVLEFWMWAVVEDHPSFPALSRLVQMDMQSGSIFVHIEFQMYTLG